MSAYWVPLTKLVLINNMKMDITIVSKTIIIVLIKKVKGYQHEK